MALTFAQSGKDSPVDSFALLSTNDFDPAGLGPVPGTPSVHVTIARATSVPAAAATAVPHTVSATTMPRNLRTSRRQVVVSPLARLLESGAFLPAGLELPETRVRPFRTGQEGVGCTHLVAGGL